MSTSLVSCHNLSHLYSGKVALNKVGFDVNAGDMIGLVGPNGAGKTTLLSIICGFLKPSSGHVSVFSQPPGAAFHGLIAALPQDASLDPAFSVGEQLRFYALLQGYSGKQADLEVLRVLDAVDLAEVETAKPDTLSHGMAKRVSIAQALIGKPRLILLDEPMAGLDPVNSRTIRGIIADLSPETTFMISSHDLTELDRLCRKILFLDNGVMQVKQLDAEDKTGQTRFLTLQMQPCPGDALIQALERLDGVEQVSNPQKNEFLITYDAKVATGMDISIIQCINENSWQYRQITQGKSLEEKLFFDS